MSLKRLALPLTLMVGVMYVAAVPAQQQEEAPPPLEPEAPPPPPRVQSGETLEPDVTITRGEKQTVEEFRANGQLYMIKVTPKVGPTYYLVDADGDGNLETRRSELDPGFRIPGWVLFRW